MIASLTLYPTPFSQLQHFSTPRLTQALSRLRFSLTARLKIGLVPALALIAVLCAFFAVRYQNHASSALKTLVDLGVSVESHGSQGYYMEIPDLIDPEIAIECLTKIRNVNHIHFVTGESPPTDTPYLRTWAWDDKEAARRIDMFLSLIHI